MDQKKFGVNLKTTGMDVVKDKHIGVSTGSTRTSASRGIRTPLKPANVSDLKAMFDKSGDGTTTTTKTETKQGAGMTSTQKTTETRTVTRRTTSNVQPDDVDTGVKVVSLTPAPRSVSRTTGIRTADEILAKVRAERMNASASAQPSSSFVTKRTTTRTVTQTSYDSLDPTSKIVSKTVTTSHSGLQDDESRDKAREYLKFSLGRVGSGKSVSSHSSEEETLHPSSPKSLQITSSRGYKSADTSPKGFKPSSEFRANIHCGDANSISSEQTSPRSFRSSSSASSWNSPRNSPSLQRRCDSRVELPVSHEHTGSTDDDETVDSSSISEVAKKYGLSSVGAASKISPTSTVTIKNDLRPKLSSGTKPLATGGTKIRLTEKKFDLLGSKPNEDPLVDKSGEKLIKFDITRDGLVSGFSDTKTQPEKTERNVVKSKLLEQKNAKNSGSFDKTGSNKEDVKVVREIKVQHIDIKNKILLKFKNWNLRQNLEQKVLNWEKKAEKQEKKEEKKSKAKKTENGKASAKEKKKSIEVVQVTPSEVSHTDSSDDSVQLKKGPSNDRITRLSEKSELIQRKNSGDRVANMFVPPGVDKRIFTRNMSSERFEKLKFDFERGCPTEHQDKVAKDAILLPQELPEVKIAPKVVKSDSFKRKEESIFASGLKVSDFVQQINANNKKTNVGRTWKKNTARVRSASASTPGENEYHEVSDGGSSDGGCYSEGEGIYEFVPERDTEITEELSGKAPSRRFGIYRKQKTANKKASFKVKSKSNSLTRNKKAPGLSKSASLEDNLSQDDPHQPPQNGKTWLLNQLHKKVVIFATSKR
ncbi:hypothetical protein LOTGIDRAFT_158474 [Lottia gigantea]|uniref:Uncharacterized protein n=1 Tax=Lottia gigantea TaxID=225164 RepID=V4AWL2_LOTGI|nr:hypothetical protein LOTGIDRAFT_158474 [Lottia gigantea]ESO99390.1 hypothetical protein LOTGIDRAFT_158474 [Lottia gigantea]